MCIFYEKNCMNEDSMYKFILLCQVKLLSRAKSIQWVLIWYFGLLRYNFIKPMFLYIWCYDEISKEFYKHHKDLFSTSFSNFIKS